MSSRVLTVLTSLALLASPGIPAPAAADQHIFIDLGSGLAGVTGAPVAIGSGPLTPGSFNAVGLAAAAPNAPTLMFVAVGGPGAVSFKGGTVLAVPFALPPILLATNQDGELFNTFTLPPGGTGLDVVVQYAVVDAAAVQGVALSNALLLELQ